MEDVLLIGGGGHCKSIIDSIKSQRHYNIAGIIDNFKDRNSYILEEKVIGTDDDLERLYNEGIKKAVITVGSVGDATIRKNIYYKLKKIGYELPVIIDPSAEVSSFAKIGEGTYIGKRAVINADSKINNCAIINTAAVVEHDCFLESFVHLAPGSVVCGNVKVGEGTHIGSNAVVIQNIKIGDNSVVGAGSVVIRDVLKETKVYGNPAKVKR